MPRAATTCLSKKEDGLGGWTLPIALEPAAPCFAHAAAAGRKSTQRRSRHPGAPIGTVRWSFCVLTAEMADAATAGKMSTKRWRGHADARRSSCVPNAWTKTVLPVSSLRVLFGEGGAVAAKQQVDHKSSSSRTHQWQQSSMHHHHTHISLPPPSPPHTHSPTHRPSRTLTHTICTNTVAHARGLTHITRSSPVLILSPFPS